METAGEFSSEALSELIESVPEKRLGYGAATLGEQALTTAVRSGVSTMVQPPCDGLVVARSPLLGILRHSR